jgi:hypothetical protein
MPSATKAFVVEYQRGPYLRREPILNEEVARILAEQRNGSYREVDCPVAPKTYLVSMWTEGNEAVEETTYTDLHAVMHLGRNAFAHEIAAELEIFDDVVVKIVDLSTGTTIYEVEDIGPVSPGPTKH